MVMKQVHLMVEHPATGRFVARKLDNPDETQLKLSLTLLNKFLKSRFKWQENPTITVEEIDDEVQDV